MGRSPPEKMTAALWPRPRDSSIHADLSVAAEPIEAVIEAAGDAGYRVTVNGLLAMVVGRLLSEFPEMNVDVRGGRLRQREAVDVWVTMADDDGRLAGRRISELDERTVLEVQDEIASAGQAHTEGSSRATNKIFGLIERLPHVVLRPTIRVIEFLMHTLRIPIPAFEINREGFGAVHITNVGPFGLRHVAAPIPPVTGQSYLLAVGEIHEAPVVREGEVVAGRVLPVTGTLDHRTVVGLRASHWHERYVELMTTPEELLGLFGDDVADEIREALDDRIPAGRPLERGPDAWSL